MKKIAVILVSALLIAEGLGAILFFGWTGKFFYTDKTTLTGQVQEAAPVQKYMFHPYVGFVPKGAKEQGGHRLATFLCGEGTRCCQAPCFEPDALIIGVFGDQWAGYAAQALARSQKLRSGLSDQPGWRDGKKIIVVDASDAASTQIQHSLRLQFLQAIGQRFDAVVLASGPNSVSVAVENGRRSIHPAYPSAQIWHGLSRQVERMNLSLYDQPGIALVYHQRRRDHFEDLASKSPIATAFLALFPIVYYHDAAAARFELRHGKQWRALSHFSTEYRPAKNPGFEPESTRMTEDALRRYGAARWRDGVRTFANSIPRGGLVSFISPINPPCAENENLHPVPKIGRYAQPNDAALLHEAGRSLPEAVRPQSIVAPQQNDEEYQVKCVPAEGFGESVSDAVLRNLMVERPQ